MQQSGASTDIYHQLARTALMAYGLPPGLAATLVNISENATFRIDGGSEPLYALRIHRHGYHSKLAIQSELAWMNELRQTGVTITPRPICGRDGELIQSLTHPLTAQNHHIVLFHWEKGTHPDLAEDLSIPFSQLGEMTAHMHLQSRTWKRPSWFTRFTWDFDTALGEENPHWGRWRDGMDVDAPRQKLFARTVALIGTRLKAYGKSPERFGLAHCDTRLANLLVDGNTVKIIDFDDSGFSWFMYDAATPMSFHEDDPQLEALLDAWKQGYRRAAILRSEDEAEIPTFIMLRRLLLVAWIGSHAETPLASSLGASYTQGTTALCETYLQKFS
jgi:Ser/Thr protein kinase RdoA (MazF antagonist)